VKKDDFRSQEDACRKHRKTSGLVFHFNLTSAVSAENEFRLPASRKRFLRILDFAQRITVVTIKPNAADLVEQVKRGKLGGRSVWDVRLSVLASKARSMGYITGRLLRIFPGALRLKKLLPIHPGAWPAESKKLELQLFKIKKYRQAGWLDRFYTEWEFALQAGRDAGIQVKQISVTPEPTPNNSDSVNWRLIETGGPRRRYSRSATLKKAASLHRAATQTG
jgi:hypothetical protein